MWKFLSLIIVIMISLASCTRLQKLDEVELVKFEELQSPTRDEIVYQKGPISHKNFYPRHVTSAKNIQTALKNAGYYTGNSDGIIGSKTQFAIEAFQKDNGLKVDGIVGQKTWVLLQKYLSSSSLSSSSVPVIVKDKTSKDADVITKVPYFTETTPPFDISELYTSSKENFTGENPFLRRNIIIGIGIALFAIILVVSIWRRPHGGV